MNIKEFVADALTQICDGIRDAQARTEGMGALIAPRLTEDGFLAHPDQKSPTVASVRFDLAVEVTTASATDGTSGAKAGISVIGLKAAVGGEEKATLRNSSAATSRLQFSIPMCWPVHDYTQAQFSRITRDSRSPARRQREG